MAGRGRTRPRRDDIKPTPSGRASSLPSSGSDIAVRSRSDPDTGEIDILGYWVGDDFGTIINPMIVEGQVQGGVAQGIGQALLEDAIYDPDSGQPVTASFLDYCMPRADDLPSIHVDSIDGYSPNNPLGVKGCGEAGAIGAPGAVINAVHDALRAVGVEAITMPATPFKIWSAINAAANR